MASWKTLLLVAVPVLGLVSAGCTDTQASNDPRRMSHITARRSVTGSNVPQASAYGDGVDDSTATRDTLGRMEQGYSSRSGGVSGGAGMSGGGGGGR